MKKKFWDSKWFSRLLQSITICSLAPYAAWSIYVLIFYVDDVFLFDADLPSPSLIIYILLSIGLFLWETQYWIYKKKVKSNVITNISK